MGSQTISDSPSGRTHGYPYVSTSIIAVLCTIAGLATGLEFTPAPVEIVPYRHGDKVIVHRGWRAGQIGELYGRDVYRDSITYSVQFDKDETDRLEAHEFALVGDWNAMESASGE